MFFKKKKGYLKEPSRFFKGNQNVGSLASLWNPPLETYILYYIWISLLFLLLSLVTLLHKIKLITGKHKHRKLSHTVHVTVMISDQDWGISSCGYSIRKN